MISALASFPVVKLSPSANCILVVTLLFDHLCSRVTSPFQALMYASVSLDIWFTIAPVAMIVLSVDFTDPVLLAFPVSSYPYCTVFFQVVRKYPPDMRSMPTIIDIITVNFPFCIDLYIIK
jgi:hypothetical protein